MKLDEYKKLTRKTVEYPEEIAFDYLTDGLNGEEGELVGKIYSFESIEGNPEEEKLLEAGDILWYTTRLCDELDYSISEVYDGSLNNLENEKDMVAKIDYECAKLSELSKKKKRDGKSLDNIDKNLGLIFESINTFVTHLGYDINYLAEKNINKLLDRKERDKIKGDGDHR